MNGSVKNALDSVSSSALPDGLVRVIDTEGVKYVLPSDTSDPLRAGYVINVTPDGFDLYYQAHGMRDRFMGRYPLNNMDVLDAIKIDADELSE